MAQRISSRVTTVSWIPTDAVVGLTAKAGFATVIHCDDPLPDVIDGTTTAEQGVTLDAWRAADRYRFANQLGAWIEVADGAVVGAGYDGGGRIGSTRVALGSHGVTVAASPMPILQAAPEVVAGDDGPAVRFVQTWGGRTGVPAPRRVRRRPFVQIQAPLVWTTLALTVHASGAATWELQGASPFPRHWVYGPDGSLQAKSGATDYSSWWRRAFGRHTPWGDTDTPAFVTAAESALERDLSTTIMRGGAKPAIRTLAVDDLLTVQGSADWALYLVLDGVLVVEVDGRPVAEIGPGSVAGERALLEDGTRTATLRAATACRVAVADAHQVDAEALAELSAAHRREDADRT